MPLLGGIFWVKMVETETFWSFIPLGMQQSGSENSTNQNVEKSMLQFGLGLGRQSQIWVTS